MARCERASDRPERGGEEDDTSEDEDDAQDLKRGKPRIEAGTGANEREPNRNRLAIPPGSIRISGNRRVTHGEAPARRPSREGRAIDASTRVCAIDYRARHADD